MKHLTLLCRIVDNLGDAGVALRLARHWLARYPGDRITLLTDDLKPFLHLIGEPVASRCATNPPSFRHSELPGLTGVQTLNPEQAEQWGDALIELFGTPIPAHWKPRLAQRTPPPVWINLEYLSAESWVASCHQQISIDPQTGWKQHFFFPGFDEHTGGLLGPDPESAIGHPVPDACAEASPKRAVPSNSPDSNSTNHAHPVSISLHAASTRQTQYPRRAFVFAYDLHPLQHWIENTATDARPAFHVATASLLAGLPTGVQTIAFVPQCAFDALLNAYDWLFVRGEDSFVRAQLCGKPFVWQIYPTPDGAHWTKLAAFFDRYTSDLEQTVKVDLRCIWWWWNGDTSMNSAPFAALHRLQTVHWGALTDLAHRWRLKVLEQCHLIDRLSALINRNPIQR